MSTTRDVSNPLRPYYRPPSIGRPQDVQPTTSSGLGQKNGSAASYASSARDMFSEVDYSDYFSDASPSTIDAVQSMLNDCLYKYFSILLSQPFDVAKTVLQVRSQGPTESAAKPIEIRSPVSGQRNTGFSDVWLLVFAGVAMLTISTVPRPLWFRFGSR
jgi:fusion and transport protein UGO1